MRAHGQRLRLLLGRGREGGRLAAERAQHEERHVPESADPDDRHAAGRVDPEPAHGRVDRDAATKERRRHGAVHPVGYQEHEATVEADAIGDAAVMAHAGGLLLAAEVLLAAQAEIALEAGASLPADADPLPDGQVGDPEPDGGDAARRSRAPGRADSCCAPSRRR